VAVANPFDILKLDTLKLVTRCEIQPVVATERMILEYIPRAYGTEEDQLEEINEEMVGTEDPELELSESEVDQIEELDLARIQEGTDSPVVKLVNIIIFNAITRKVSDIHIECFEKFVRIRFRKDGVLYVFKEYPKKLANAITSRLKIMSQMDIAERRKPQDGKFQLRALGRQIDFRVSVLPCIHGEKTVMRLLDAGNLTPNLDVLGFEPQVLREFRDAIHSPYGMLLVTGPTGSGKSTTLYSSIQEVMSIESNLITVEEPVEYQLEGINQVPVSVKRGLTFAAALRSILRQDPDTVMIGEIRDLETIEIAIKAALTGHLVLSTLHTNDAPSTISRMVDMGVDPFMVASSVVMVAAQRLCRSLCNDCKELLDPLPPADRMLELGFLPDEIKTAEIYEPGGCPRCLSGYKGRFAVVESLVVGDEIRRMIIEGRSASELKERALDLGMMTLRRAALKNSLRGRTSLAEVMRVTMADR
jgi:type IV pilus assembly protein PilB